MSALQDLTEEEKYLVSILNDPSGIELAEFLFIDELNSTGCFRAWPFQWPFYRNENKYQIAKAARAIGKSSGLIMRACAFIFNYPGREMLIYAPQVSHLKPLTDKVEQKLRSVRLLSEMLPKKQGSGITHIPHFECQAVNNARILSRIPGPTNKGAKGLHSTVTLIDEAQDLAEGAWIEVTESTNVGEEESLVTVSGVSRGTRDKFYEYTEGENPDLPFYVHKYPAMYRPTWNEKERQTKIALYGGSSQNVDYRRNIYGDSGDVSNPLFVLARLMATVRIAETPWAEEYNRDVYTCIKINDELFRDRNSPIEAFIDIPGTHLDDGYRAYFAGLDYGATRDPSEILVFGEYKLDKDNWGLRLLLRVQMMRISSQDQAAAVRHIFELYGARLETFTFDKSGNGLSLWQEMNPEAVGTYSGNRTTPEHIMKRIVGYGFSERIAVDFDDRELEGKEKPEDAVIKKNVVDYGYDELRKLVDQKRIELPYDKQLLTEFQGQSIEYVRDEGSASGIKKSYKSSLHTLDAAVMFIVGRNLRVVRETLNAKPVQDPVTYLFG